jgi:hypothetical protein
MKTIDDYLNDPRILNDPDMVGALEPIREIHAIRLKIQDEVSGMTVEEEVAYINKKARDALAARGINAQFVNLAGQGKLIPRAVVE